MEDFQYELHSQAEERLWWHRIVRRAIRESLDAHLPPGRRRVLDAGCGTGGVMRDLTRAGYDVVGVDISPLALAHARARGCGPVLVGSADRLPFTDATFDAATSIDVVSQHSVDADAALGELRRVLRPGGILVLQVSAFRALAGEHDRTAHQDRYERAELIDQLRRNGLEPRSLRYRLAFLPPLMLVNNALAKLKADREPDLSIPSRPVNAALRLAGLLDWRLGRRAPFGSSLWAVAERA